MSVMTRRTVAVFAVVAVFCVAVQNTAWAATPGAPTALAATPGDKQVALTWTAPAVTGGGAGIATYNVEYSTNGGGTWTQVVRANDTTAAYTVTGLVNGTAYSFQVKAVNGSDVGVGSTGVSATPFVVYTASDLATYSACPTAIAGLIPQAGFTDVTSTHVDCIKYYGITKGTTATTYSPTASVTRWQMALFLTRMAIRAEVTLPDGSDQGFTDISGESTEIRTAINQIKQLGITVGKTATTYAPADNVTREEMALFISRFLQKATVGPGGNTELGSGSSAYQVIKSLVTNSNFTDITQNTYEIRDAIANLWNLGVTDVQAGTLYEPVRAMTRKEMAIFMANALAHTNARPKGLVLQSSSYRLQGGYHVTLSVTHRTDGFVAIANTPVDTFRFNHSIVSTVTRFDTGGMCTVNVSATSLGNTKCTVDTSDPKTAANGNLAIITEVPPTANLFDVWAWTATPTTVYYDSLHAAGASKISIQTIP